MSSSRASLLLRQSMIQQSEMIGLPYYVKLKKRDETELRDENQKRATPSTAEEAASSEEILHVV